MFNSDALGIFPPLNGPLIYPSVIIYMPAGWKLLVAFVIKLRFLWKLQWDKNKLQDGSLEGITLPKEGSWTTNS